MSLNKQTLLYCYFKVTTTVCLLNTVVKCIDIVLFRPCAPMLWSPFSFAREARAAEGRRRPKAARASRAQEKGDHNMGARPWQMQYNYNQGSTGIAFSAGTGTGTGIGKKCRDRDFAGTGTVTGTGTITGTGTVTGTGISTGTGTEKFSKFSKISYNYTLNSTILRRKSPDT